MKPSCTSLRVHEEKPSLGFSWRSEVIPHRGHRGSALAAAQTHSCVLESVPALYSSLQKGLERGKYQPEFTVVFRIYNNRFRVPVNVKQEEAISSEAGCVPAKCTARCAGSTEGRGRGSQGK